MDEATEESMKRTFGADYLPPPPNNTEVLYGEQYEDDWFQTIEIKLSNQGKLIAGLGAVALGTLVLTVLQGKVVITLAKSNRGIIDAINGIINGTVSAVPSKPSYSEPSGKVDESKIEPIDQEELDELKRRMEASTKDANGEIL